MPHSSSIVIALNCKEFNGGGTLFINTNYEKKTLTKNLAGEPEEYQLLLSVEFTVLKDNSQIKLKLNEKFVMNNFSDDFEERNYETNIKKSMVNLIYNKFLKQIRNLK